MGVYTISNDIFNEGSMNLEVGIQESQYNDIMEANFAMLAESEQNYNTLMQAVGIAEVSYFSETGEELVYESSNISGFFSKAKEFLKSLLEKIKGIFRKFFSMFDSYTKTDKEFINKYRNHLLKINTRDFEYKGFNFDLNFMEKLTGANIKKNIEGAKIMQDAALLSRNLDVVKAAQNNSFDNFIKDTEQMEDVIEGLRAAAIGQSSGLTASEFNKEIFEGCRNNESTKEVLDNISVADLIMVISNSSKNRKDAEKAFKEIERAINDEIKNFDKEEKNLIKAVPSDKAGSNISKAVTASSRGIQLTKAKLTIMQTCNAAMLTAIKDHNRQSKSICVALMNYKPKNEGFSFGEEYDNGSSFLENVVMR